MSDMDLLVLVRKVLSSSTFEASFTVRWELLDGKAVLETLEAFYELRYFYNKRLKAAGERQYWEGDLEYLFHV